MDPDRWNLCDLFNAACILCVLIVLASVVVAKL